MEDKRLFFVAEVILIDTGYISGFKEMPRRKVEESSRFTRESPNKEREHVFNLFGKFCTSDYNG